VGAPLAHGYVGDVTDAAFRTRVFADLHQRHDCVNICVPAAGITRDALAVKLDKQKDQISIYPLESFRWVIEVDLIAPVYWSLELVAGIADQRKRNNLRQWQPEEDIQGVVVFIGSVSSLGNIGQIAYSAAKAGLEGAAA